MEISEKERLLSVVGGFMCADSKTPHERCISPYRPPGNRSPKEAIMANAASGKVRTPAVEITRGDALSEILAESWWLVGLRGILGIIFGLICLLNPSLRCRCLSFCSPHTCWLTACSPSPPALRRPATASAGGLLIVEGIVDLAAG